MIGLAALKLIPWRLVGYVAATLVAAFICWRIYDNWRDAIYAAGAKSRDAEVATLTSERDIARDQLSQAQSANASNLLTIEILRADNQAFADAAQVKQDEAARAVARLESERARLASQLAAAREARRTLIEGNSDAKRWATTGLPAVLRDSLLREYGHAETGNTNGNGPVGGAGVQGAAGRIDRDRPGAVFALPDAVFRGRLTADLLRQSATRLDRRVAGGAADG